MNLKKRKKIILGIIIMIAALCAGCSGEVTDSVLSRGISDSYLEEYSSEYTIGEVFRYYFTNGTWSFGENILGDDLVRFEGGCLKDGEQVWVAIVFQYFPNNFELDSMWIDDDFVWFKSNVIQKIYDAYLANKSGTPNEKNDLGSLEENIEDILLGVQSDIEEGANHLQKKLDEYNEKNGITDGEAPATRADNIITLDEPGYVVVNCDVLNVRDGAGSQENIITTVQLGDVLYITKVCFNSEQVWGYDPDLAGWVALEYTIAYDDYGNDGGYDEYYGETDETEEFYEGEENGAVGAELTIQPKVYEYADSLNVIFGGINAELKSAYYQDGDLYAVIFIGNGWEEPITMICDFGAAIICNEQEIAKGQFGTLEDLYIEAGQYTEIPLRFQGDAVYVCDADLTGAQLVTTCSAYY